MKKKNNIDVIIVGGSYAGLAAAMALGRALREVLVIDNGNPCNRQTPYSHNFLTHDGRPPAEIAGLARQQVLNYETVRLLNDTVQHATKHGDGFRVQLESGEMLASRKLVISSGIKDTLPEIPGLRECWGQSVLHCPYCHGYEVRNQPTGLLANGDTAFEMAALLSNWTNDLTLFTNSKSTLNELQRSKLRQHNIAVVEKEILLFEQRNGILKHIIFTDESKREINVVYARPSFMQHSNIPESLGCELTPEGYISIDVNQRTTVQGVYACGDNASRMRTVANAVASGTTTGLMVNKELTEETF